MHDRQWVRIGFAFVLASTGVVAASVAGCGDDNGPGAMPGSDASNDSTMPQPDSGGMPETGGGDTGPMNGDSGEGGSSKNAEVFLVHASETAPPLRFCFAIPHGDAGAVTVVSTFFADPSTAAAGLPFPGVFPGTGGLLDNHGVDLATLSVAAFAIDARKITMDTADGGPEGGAERNCAQLLGTDGLGSAGMGGGALTRGTDFWPLGTIPAGTLAHGTSWVFAITGCTPGAAFDAGVLPGSCGTNYDATKGNLGFTSFQLDSTSVAPMDKMGAQIVHASQAWDAFQQGLGAGVFSAGAFYIEELDAGTMPSDAGGAPDTGAGTDAAADSGTVADASADATTGSDAAAEASAADSGGGTEAGGGSDASTTPPTKNLPFAIPAPYGAATPKTMYMAPGLTFDGTSGIAMSFVNGATPVGMPAAFPLPVVQELTYGTTAAGAPAGLAFSNGMTFAFVFVGDPTLPQLINPVTGMPCAAQSATCIFNGRSVHFLAFPAYNQ